MLLSIGMTRNIVRNREPIKGNMLFGVHRENSAL